jgi:aldose 1-epimerase
MNLPSGNQLRLAHSDQELIVVEVGGGIRSYRRGGVDVIDGYDQNAVCSGGRGQILAPWPNRLADGRYEWDGRSFQAALSEPDHHNAIHGLVRWANWTVSSVSGTEARAEYRLHPQPGWGWTLDLRVVYRLDPTGLEVETTLTNTSPDTAGSCPVGIGWHPYLAAFGALVDEVTLTLPARFAYQADERGIPVGRRPVVGTDQDFSGGRLIGSARLDTAFTDLERDGGGRAWVELRGASAKPGLTRMWIDGSYTHVMVFSGDTLADPTARRRGLAVEPMTCAPDALHSGDGITALEPGESLTASWGLAD